MELVEGGNADDSGMIEVGDVLVGCGFDLDAQDTNNLNGGGGEGNVHSTPQP